MNRRWLPVRSWAAWLGGGWLLGLALVGAWTILLEPAIRSGEVTELVIPRGTAEAVARGEPAPFIPDVLQLGYGNELRVRNLDLVEHRVAGRAIPPGATASVRSEAGSDTITCTIHPSGSIGVLRDGRPGLVSIFLVSLLIGVPLGGLSGCVALVMRRLDTGQGEGLAVIG